jgi:hypothetical protein
MKRIILATLFAASLLAPAASRAEHTSRLVDHAQLSFAVPADSARVHDAIIEVGKRHGWTVSSDEAGKLRLGNTIRGTFKVVVDVAYTGSGMQVDYVSSENLYYQTKHGVPYIHPKYNKWVDLLMQETKARLAGGA